MRGNLRYEVLSGTLLAMALAFLLLLAFGNSAGKAAVTALFIGVGAAIGIYLGRSTAYRRAERYRQQAQQRRDDS